MTAPEQAPDTEARALLQDFLDYLTRPAPLEDRLVLCWWDGDQSRYRDLPDGYKRSPDSLVDAFLSGDWAP